MVGAVLIVAGIGAIVASGAITRERVSTRWGRADEVTLRQSEGTGVVPSWVSLLNLGGWAAVAIGVIMILLALFSS